MFGGICRHPLFVEKTEVDPVQALKSAVGQFGIR